MAILDIDDFIGEYTITEDCFNDSSPYIEKYDLENKFDKLFHMDVKDFTDFKDYDVIIFGDILEHHLKVPKHKKKLWLWVLTYGSSSTPQISASFYPL